MFGNRICNGETYCTSSRDGTEYKATIKIVVYNTIVDHYIAKP